MELALGRRASGAGKRRGRLGADEDLFEGAAAEASAVYQHAVDLATHDYRSAIAQLQHDLAAGTIDQATYDADAAQASDAEGAAEQSAMAELRQSVGEAAATQITDDADAQLSDATQAADAEKGAADAIAHQVHDYTVNEAADYDAEQKQDAQALETEETSLADGYLQAVQQILVTPQTFPWIQQLLAQAQAEAARVDGPGGAAAAEKNQTDADADAEQTEEDSTADAQLTRDLDADQHARDLEVAQAQTAHDAQAAVAAADDDAFPVDAPAPLTAPSYGGPITVSGNYGYSYEIGGYTMGDTTPDYGFGDGVGPWGVNPWYGGWNGSTGLGWKPPADGSGVVGVASDSAQDQGGNNGGGQAPAGDQGQQDEPPNENPPAQDGAPYAEPGGSLAPRLSPVSTNTAVSTGMDLVNAVTEHGADSWQAKTRAGIMVLNEFSAMVTFSFAVVREDELQKRGVPKELEFLEIDPGRDLIESGLKGTSAILAQSADVAVQMSDGDVEGALKGSAAFSASAMSNSPMLKGLATIERVKRMGDSNAEFVGLRGIINVVNGSDEAYDGPLNDALKAGKWIADNTDPVSGERGKEAAPLVEFIVVSIVSPVAVNALEMRSVSTAPELRLSRIRLGPLVEAEDFSVAEESLIASSLQIEADEAALAVRLQRFTNTRELQFADRTWFEDFEGYRALKVNIEKNGLRDKIIEFVELDGQRYVLRGNGRLQIAEDLQIEDQLLFKEVDLPFLGYRNKEDVLEEAWNIIYNRPRGIQ